MESLIGTTMKADRFGDGNKEIVHVNWHGWVGYTRFMGDSQEHWSIIEIILGSGKKRNNIVLVREMDAEWEDINKRIADSNFNITEYYELESEDGNEKVFKGRKILDDIKNCFMKPYDNAHCPRCDNKDIYYLGMNTVFPTEDKASGYESTKRDVMCTSCNWGWVEHLKVVGYSGMKSLVDSGEKPKPLGTLQRRLSRYPPSDARS